MDKALARWTPPPEGWIKINVDAGFVEGRSSGALGVRDHRGNLLFAASTVFYSSSLFLPS